MYSLTSAVLGTQQLVGALSDGDPHSEIMALNTGSV